MWRPENWDGQKIITDYLEKHEVFSKDSAILAGVEAGADAILGSLLEDATPMGVPHTAYENERKGWLVFIPEDKK